MNKETLIEIKLIQILEFIRMAIFLKNQLDLSLSYVISQTSTKTLNLKHGFKQHLIIA